MANRDFLAAVRAPGEIKRRTPRFGISVTKFAIFGSSSSAPGTTSAFTTWQNGAATKGLFAAIKEGLLDLVSPLASKSYAAGGANRTSVAAQADTAVSESYNNASIIVQCDLQASDFTVVGGGHTAAVWFDGTLRPKFDSTVTSDKRFLAWVGTFGSEQAYASPQWTQNVIFEQKLWDTYPGQVLNMMRYVPFMPRDGGEQDFTELTSGTIPKSLQIPDRSHSNSRGHIAQADACLLAFVEATQGGLPFFTDHYYHVTASTAQTADGVVCTLGFVGSLSGCTLSLTNPDGSTSTEFVINSSTAAVKRAPSGITTLKRPYDLFVNVQRGEFTRAHHIVIGIGNLTTAPSLCHFDGHLGATVWSNDFTGSEAAPTYDSVNGLQWANLPQGQTEGSMVWVIQPDADKDGVQMYLDYEPNGLQVQRQATGAFDLIMKDDSAGSFGSISSGTTEATGRCNNADGVRWVFWSFSCPNNRQRLVIVNDADGVVKRNTTATVSSKTTGALNGKANPSGTIRQRLLLGGSVNGYSNTYKGMMGPRWKAAKEIDFNDALNRALFRAGAASFVDVGAAGSVVVAAGPNVGVTVSPYDYWDGNAADFVGGRNRGTGGKWQAWQRRVLHGSQPDWTQGVPYNP